MIITLKVRTKTSGRTGIRQSILRKDHVTGVDPLIDSRWDTIVTIEVPYNAMANGTIIDIGRLNGVMDKDDPVEKGR